MQDTGNSSHYTYMTSLSTDHYLIGVLVLHKSLKKVNSRYPLTVLCSSSISDNTLKILSKNKINYNQLTESFTIPITKTSINQEDNYQHWTNTFDKLLSWKQTHFDRIILIDSDMVVIKNIDHLFNWPINSAVVSDIYNQPNCTHLNSGLMVIKPSIKTFNIFNNSILHITNAKANIGDQDVIINYVGKEWSSRQELHLPIGYNLYYYDIHKYRMQVGQNWRKDIFVVHFIGKKKPWDFSFRAVLRRIKRYGAAEYMIMYMYLIYKAKITLLFMRIK